MNKTAAAAAHWTRLCWSYYAADWCQETPLSCASTRGSCWCVLSKNPFGVDAPVRARTRTDLKAMSTTEDDLNKNQNSWLVCHWDRFRKMSISRVMTAFYNLKNIFRSQVWVKRMSKKGGCGVVSSASFTCLFPNLAKWGRALLS